MRKQKEPEPPYVPRKTSWLIIISKKHYLKLQPTPYKWKQELTTAKIALLKLM